MKRYSPKKELYEDCEVMKQYDDGEYVLYEEAVAQIDELKAENESLRESNHLMGMEVDENEMNCVGSNEEIAQLNTRIAELEAAIKEIENNPSETACDICRRIR